MPDEAKQPQKRKPAAPKVSPTPAQQRKQLIDDAVHDFTFKSDVTDEQRDAFIWVLKTFSEFNNEMLRLFDFSKIRKQLSQTDDYQAFSESSRKAERWANSAIANDWKTNSAFDVDSAEGIEYPILEAHTSEEQRLCYEVSKRCFELTTKILSHLPLGRHLSLFKTEMQVARGWLIDTVNRNNRK